MVSLVLLSKISITRTGLPFCSTGISLIVFTGLTAVGRRTVFSLFSELISNLLQVHCRGFSIIPAVICYRHMPSSKALVQGRNIFSHYSLAILVDFLFDKAGNLKLSLCSKEVASNAGVTLPFVLFYTFKSFKRQLWQSAQGDTSCILSCLSTSKVHCTH